MVNGYPVREYVLRPGDVLALGDALLIYGEGIADKSDKDSMDSEDDGTQTLSLKKR
jgi:hypothetical protein